MSRQSSLPDEREGVANGFLIHKTIGLIYICLLSHERPELHNGGNVGILSRLFGKSVPFGDDIADDIVQAAVLGGQTLVHNWVGDESPDASGPALAANECLYFLLHYINRLAFAAGGRAAQQKVYDPITRQAVAKLAALVPSSSRPDAVSMLQEGVNAAELIYAKCRSLAPKGNDSLAGTLFWEVSKCMCAAVGNGKDFANIAVATQILTATLSALKLEKRIPALV